MSNPSYSAFSSELRGADALTRLALDLQWSWNHSSDEIWRRLDPELWELTGNPWLILQSISQNRLDQLSDPAFRKVVEERLAEVDERKTCSAWFQRAYPKSPITGIAYFSMEYMLSEALPVYSGGLGNVAADQLKAASDLGVPVVAVGLLYQQGYFRQELDKYGEQLALYPVNEPGQLPIRPVRTAEGDWLRMQILLPGAKIWVRTWEVTVGRNKLYLLDTNDPANLPQYRSITSELYGGGPELRLKQEMLLGIAGWRLLRILGIAINVCHLNEGHAALALLERARGYMKDTGRPFEESLAVTRAGNVFTTHTSVDAGFDRFSTDLIHQYLGAYSEQLLGVPLHDLIGLGRRNPRDESEPFNMAYLAIRGCGSINGVSRLHGEVSRRLFQPLFPRFPEAEVPVGYVTNGIHVPTWDSAGADHLWTELCGKGIWRGDLENIEAACQALDDTQLWQMRAAGRKALAEYARERLHRQEASRAVSPFQVERSRKILGSDALTIGFARRFATYKRPDLLLHDPERLARILTDPHRPVQLVLAGKAHPQDLPARALIRKWVDFVRRPDVRPHAVFIADYDMLLAERMVEGVDVWINTPRRPWEASGTSGMKVLVNGGLNLSVLDGWWAEAWSPDVGWAIGDGKEHNNDPAWDDADAEALYRVLENEIIPEFYQRDEFGLPRAWLARVKASMIRLTPAFSANRTVRQYTKEHYLPAATAYAGRAAEGGATGAALAHWRRKIARCWPEVHFGEMNVFSNGGETTFEVEVNLAGLTDEEVRLELFANATDGGVPYRQQMRRKDANSGASVMRVYSARVPATRPAADFTVRILPYHSLAAPVEIDRILWQK